jgi:acyl carrier protein
MRTVEHLDDLIGLANDELGMGLAPQDATTPLDGLPGWDSMHILRLVSLLEEALGRPLPLADVLAARTLEDIWTWTVRT